MRTVFADANYRIALLYPQDELHDRAIRVSEDLGTIGTVTSEMVLAEVLNMLSKYGSQVRGAAVALVNKLRSDPNTEVVPQTSLLFQGAMNLYSERGDKNWSLTDCSSFLIMQDQKINEALTYDENFAQAGFKALLREKE